MKYILFLVFLALISCHLQSKRKEEEEIRPIYRFHQRKHFKTFSDPKREVRPIRDIHLRKEFNNLANPIKEIRPIKELNQRRKMREEQNNFDIMEIIKCALNTPEVLEYYTKILALLKQGKFDEIYPLVIEALPTVAQKLIECAFPLRTKKCRADEEVCYLGFKCCKKKK